MSPKRDLTAFEIFYSEGRVNYRLFFPPPMYRRRISRSRSLVFFPPGEVVGYGRWRANEFGTQIWRCFVLRTVYSGESAVRLPGVSPGADILLATRGAERSKRFLTILDGLKTSGTPLTDISAAYWRQLHLALFLRRAARDLTKAQLTAGASGRRLKS